MVLRRSFYTFLTIFIVLSLFLVACERPLQTDDTAEVSETVAEEEDAPDAEAAEGEAESSEPVAEEETAGGEEAAAETDADATMEGGEQAAGEEGAPAEGEAAAEETAGEESAPAEGEAAAEEPATEEEAASEDVAVAADSLTAGAWQWISFTSPVEQFDVEAPESYVATFNEDGTLTVRADCNNAIGSYTSDESSLSVEMGPMTLAACPEDSRSDQFLAFLSSAAIYFFEDGNLYIDLMADGGTMVFAPVTEAVAGAEGEGTTEEEAEATGELEGTPHTVAEGETIFDIAAQYDASWVVVAQYNNIEDVNNLTVGAIIYIPPQEVADEMAAAAGDEEATGEETSAETEAGTEASGEAAPAPESSAPAGPTVTYIVQRGDTLFRIGLKYNVSWVEIAEANGIQNPNYIQAGQELKIPVSAPGPTPEFTHVVQRGETLFRISLQYDVPWQAIAQRNRIRPPYMIYAGQTLVIPGNNW